MSNLFSSFDPCQNFLGLSSTISWFSLLFTMSILSGSYWLMNNTVVFAIKSIQKYLSEELVSIMGINVLSSNFVMLISSFFFIIIVNLMGLLPYVFTSTAHLVFTLTLSVPMWIGHISISLFSQPIYFFSHLVPLGTPSVLMPLMVIIESVSNIIRPVTLAVRLAANMTAGHLLLILLGGLSSAISPKLLILVMPVVFCLVVLELAVACIQSYVITILSTLYVNEHTSLDTL